MKNLKRILCLLLVCVLVGSLLPMTAAAATEYDIAGVEAIGSGYLYNSAKGAYQPKWTSTKALAPDGSALDYGITTGLFYKSYSGGTFGEKLTTAPAFGETYYSYLIIDCPNDYNAELDENLFKINIPGFIVEYKTDYFGDAGFSWRIIFSATRYEDVYVGGVRLQAGQCLPSGASTSQVDKPETGYAYNAGKYLELNCYSYEGNGLSRKAGIYAEHDLAIKVIGNCSLYMAEGCDGIVTTQSLLYVSGGPLTIYADRCGIYAGKNVTLSNGSMNNSKLIIETNREECVYAGNDLTVGDYAILNLNCKDTGNYGLGALKAENGSVSMGSRDVLVANKAYGTLKTPHSAADVASYPRIVVHKFTDQVIVGNVKLTDGQYLAVGGTAATTAKPSGGYAYFSDGILTLHNYTLKNSPYKTSSYTTYDEYIQIFAPKAYVLSLSGNNKLESDEKVTSAVRAPNDLFIQQAAAGGSLEIDSYKGGIYAYNSEVFFDSGNLDITSVNTGIECGNGTLFFNNCDLTVNSRNTYGIFQRDDYGDPPANQNDITVIGGKLDIRSQYEGIRALSAASDFRMTGGECTVVTDRGSAIEAGNNIRILGGKLYLKVVSDYWDSGTSALHTRYGQTVIASGLPVKASTESYGQLGAYDPAKVKEYDWVTIGSPTEPQLTSYTVTFNPNGGPGETVTFTGINEGGYVTMPEAPAADWDGRAFLGWKPADATGNTVLEPGKNSNITKDTEFLAQWEPVALAEANAFIDVPTRGKTPDMTPTVPEGANYTAQVDYYYYATSGSYYHMTATDTFPAYKNCSLRIKFIPNPGYKFDQNTKFTVNGRSTDHYGNPGAEEVDFYVFGPKVTFDPNGGSVSTTDQAVNSSGNLSTLPTPTWKDNTMRFDGWYTQKTGGEEVSTSTKFTDDTTIYARWVENRYTITFDPNGGSVTPTTKQTDTDGWLTDLPIPTHSDPNKLFDGWHTSKTSYSQVADECKFSKDTTLYAHWKDKPAHTIAEVYIDSVQIPAAGVMPSNHVTITTAGVHGITDSGDTFWVRYDAATNNLTDTYEDSSYVDSVPFRAGETYLLMLVMEAQPSYGFTPDVKVFYKGKELPAPSMSDMTASAILDHDDEYICVIINPGKAENTTYTVTFDSDGGSAVAKQTVEKGKAAAKPADPTKEGYTFKGWYLGSSKYDFGKPVTGNITLKAKWEAKHTHTYSDGVDGTCNGCGAHREEVETRVVVHMFRMYNPNTGEHFYTGSTVERDNLIAVGWQYEGIGFTFPANTGLPVHRLFQPSTGEHLYTMSEAEKDKLMAEGWNYEGIAFNSAYDTEAVQHRLHNPNATVGAYHFTFSQEEMNNLIAAGWEYQGIGWYSCWK